MSDDETKATVLSKNTVVSVTLSTLGATFLLGMTSVTYWNNYTEEVNDRFEGVESRLLLAEAEIDENEEEIGKTALRVDINSVLNQISRLEGELRGLSRELRKDPENDLLVDQIDDVKRKLKKLNDSLRCFQQNPKDPDHCRVD